MADLRQEAAARRELHANHASSRPFNAGYEETALRGEQAFARDSGLERDRSLRPGGDGGVDFWMHVDGKLRSIDVKASRHPVALRVEVGHVVADIFVQAGVDDYLGDGLIGWAWRDEVLAAPIRPQWYGGRDIPFHTLPARLFRPMRDLWARRTQ